MRPAILGIAIIGALIGAESPQRDAARTAAAALEKSLPEAADVGDFMHLIAVNRAILGEKETALAWLQKLSALYPDFDPSADSEFAPLAPDPAFQALVARARKNSAPVRRARVAFRVAEADLAPEGIAWDPAENALYVGSIHKRKIVKIGRDGAVRDFVASGQDGLRQVLGMKVHAGTLWAASTSETENGVFVFDLRTGKLVRKHLLPGKHQFNDLVVTRAGDAFVTDTNAGRIYHVSKAGLEEFAARFPYANGIAISPDEKTLFVAHFNGGISALDIASRKSSVLPKPAGVSTAGIDGLYFYKGSLLAIQNGFGAPRVMRYFLSPALDRIEKAEILEWRNPLFQVPTTGAVAGDAFYFMANTCLDRYENGAFTPGPALKPLLILELRGQAPQPPNSSAAGTR